MPHEGIKITDIGASWVIDRGAQNAMFVDKGSGHVRINPGREGMGTIEGHEIKQFSVGEYQGLPALMIERQEHGSPREPIFVGYIGNQEAISKWVKTVNGRIYEPSTPRKS